MSETCSAAIGEAPEALYGELRRPLARYLRSLGLDGAAAEDVIQDAFLKLQQHTGAGGSRENLRGWVFRVAHNEARNRMARHEYRRGGGLELAAPVADGGPSPEGRVLDRERMVRLKRGLGSLTEVERQCLFLRSEGLRYREIGEVVSLPVSTVADVVNRAVRRLAEMCNV